MRLGDLIAEDEVRVAQDVELILGHRAEAADGQTRARERLAHDQILRQAELAAERAHLVLKQQTQRLNDLLEIHKVRQAADVVVALDDGGDIRAGFDHVGIDRTLSQIVDRADLLALFLKDADELLTDDLALRLRVRDVLQAREKALFRVDAHKIDVPVLERSLDLIALVLAQQTVIDKDARELIADRLRQQSGRDRGIHAAGKGQQHLAAADLGADVRNGLAHEVTHRPLAGRAADLIEEVAQHGPTILGMIDLRVELHAIKPARFVADADRWAGIRVRHEPERLRHLGHVVAVAHPRDALLRQTAEETAVGIEPGLRLAVLACGVLSGSGHFPAEILRHELAAVADAEDWDSEPEDLRIYLRRAFGVHALRAAGEDDTDGVKGTDLVDGHGVRLDFAIHIALAHTARNELIILSSKIEDDDRLIRHG